jgi:crotonobetainyl-CoA:carnitine CoA-transferase CaiB-like acyl-CoA transferase
MWRWLGEPEEFADERFGRLKDRFEARDRLFPLIEKLCASRTREQVAAEGEQHGVPATGLWGFDEVVEHEHFLARGALGTDEIEPGREAVVPTGMLEDENGRLGRRSRAPQLGEHTAEVAADWALPRPAPEPPAPTPGEQPLSGLRVIDLGVIVAGAEVSRLLADHGAEVVKVESSRFPDGSRQSADGSSMTPSFAWGNRNKSSIGIDLRSERGREMFLRLVAQSDVVLSNFKPGTMASLGLDDAALRAVNGRVITFESSAFGRTGPWARRGGYGPLVRAGAGLSSLWRYPDDPDSFSDTLTVYPDHAAGRLGALAVLSKVIERSGTGCGGAVAVAQSEIIATQMAGAILSAQLRPGSVGPEGTDRRDDAPRGVFACAGDDEWCVVDVRGDAAFAALARAVGHPEWIDDPRFADAASRARHRAALRSAVEEWTAARDPHRASADLQDAGVAAGYMQRVAEFPDDPQFVERGFLVQLDQPDFDDPLPAHGAEGRSRLVPGPRLGPAPHQGEHTRDVAARLLGLTATEIEEHLAAGVLEEPAPGRGRDPGPSG